MPIPNPAPQEDAASWRGEAVSPVGAEARVSDAARAWRARLVDLAAASSLEDMRRASGSLVDITAAHPSGIAQLLAGRPTRLTSLFRERAGLTVARRRLRRVVVDVSGYRRRLVVACLGRAGSLPGLECQCWGRRSRRAIGS